MAYLAVAHNVQQGDNVWTSAQVLENLDFTLYLLLLDGFEDFDDAFLVVDNIDAFEDFGVLSSTCMSRHVVSKSGSDSRLAARQRRGAEGGGC